MIIVVWKKSDWILILVDYELIELINEIKMKWVQFLNSSLVELANSKRVLKLWNIKKYLANAKSSKIVELFSDLSVIHWWWHNPLLTVISLLLINWKISWFMNFLCCFVFAGLGDCSSFRKAGGVPRNYLKLGDCRTGK